MVNNKALFRTNVVYTTHEWHHTVATCIFILKTIGNREGDCAWSCSRWQTQPEKISKSQRTNQRHSLRTLYWFVLCILQIFSGCVCHLEQLHAQSPFLFPIVFSINLIPFFDIANIGSVLAVLSPGLFAFVLLYLGHCAVATVAVCGFGSWSLVLHCGMPRQISPLPPTPLSNRSALHEGRKHKTVVSSQPNALREEARHTNLPFLAIGCHADCLGERRTSPFNGIERSLSFAVVIKIKFLSVSATTFPTALSLYIAHDWRKHKHNPTLSANNHVVQICRSSLSAAADGLADGFSPTARLGFSETCCQMGMNKMFLHKTTQERP